MSAPGWVKIHRSIIGHWCSSDPDALAVWVRLICEANFEDKKTSIGGRLIDVKRGQLVFGLNAFSERSGVSVKVLRRVISQLEMDGMLGKQNFNKFSLITITCYDDYQDEGRQRAGKGQAEGRQRATPKEVKNLRSKETDSTSPDDDALEGSYEKAKNVPHQAVIDLYHKNLPMLAETKVWNDRRRKALKARWFSGLSHPEHGGINELTWWDAYFAYVARCPHLIGENDRGWSADLEWLINETNLIKVIEGRYSK